jgi:CcmD family protein
MSPDTSTYMLAGFIVIFSGIMGYVITLALRARDIKERISRLAHDDDRVQDEIQV